MRAVDILGIIRRDEIGLGLFHACLHPHAHLRGLITDLAGGQLEHFLGVGDLQLEADDQIFAVAGVIR